MGEWVCANDGAGVVCSTRPGGPADQSLPETCNDVDDDCDGELDEEVAFGLLANDPLNCGACDEVCSPLPNADPVCDAGRCGFVCRRGFIDGDGIEANGCELECAEEVPRVVQGGGVADINAAIQAAGPCGVVEVSGEILQDAGDPPVRADLPGQTLRFTEAWFVRRAGYTAPFLLVTANGVAVEGGEFREGGGRALEVRGVSGFSWHGPDFRATRQDRAVFEARESVAALYVVDSENVVLSGIGTRGTGWVVNLGHDLPELAASIVEVVDSRRVEIRDSRFVVDSLVGDRHPAVVRLVGTEDSTVSGNVVLLRRGMDHGHGYGIGLVRSDRNTVHRNDFRWDPDPGDEPLGGLVGLLVDGVGNTITGNTFGGADVYDNPETLCLRMAVELTSSRNTVVDNVYHGARFGLWGEGGAPELVGVTARYPLPPTNLGAWLLRGGAGLEVSGNRIEMFRIRRPTCDPEEPIRYDYGDFGLVSVRDASNVRMAGNTVTSDDGDYWYLWEPSDFRTAGCLSTFELVDVDGAEVTGNRGVPPRNPCPEDEHAPPEAPPFISDVVVRAVAVENLEVEDLAVAEDPEAPFRLLAEGSRSVRVDLSGRRGGLALKASSDVEIANGTIGGGTFSANGLVLRDLEVDGALDIHSERAPLLLERVSASHGLALRGSSARVVDTTVGPWPCVGRPAEEGEGLNCDADECVLQRIRVCGERGISITSDTAGTIDHALVAGRRTLIGVGRPAVIRHVTGVGAENFRPDALSFSGFWNHPDPRAHISNSVFVQIARPAAGDPGPGTATITHTNVFDAEQEWPDTVELGEGMLSVDPLFADALLHLSADSPLVDAGDPATDASPEPAPNGGRVNIGFYGGTPHATPTPE